MRVTDDPEVLWRPFRAWGAWDYLPRASLHGCAVSLCPGLTCLCPFGAEANTCAVVPKQRNFKSRRRGSRGTSGAVGLSAGFTQQSVPG